MDSIETNIEELRKQLATCRRIYRYLDGIFVYQRWHVDYPLKVRPARERPQVLFVNDQPMRNSHQKVTIGMGNYSLTTEEVGSVVPDSAHDYHNWPTTEAMFYAAEYGNLFRIDTYVLNQSSDEVLGRRNALKEGKCAFAVEFYNVIEGKEGLMKRSKN